MDILALVCGFALPWILGVALLQAMARATATRDGPGTLAWTVGCGWFAGAFLLTLWMRALSATGVPFGVIVIGLPLAAGAAVASWLVWRRHPRALGESARAALRVLAGADLAAFPRVAWRALLAWLVFRFALLLAEVVSRPLYPWDAWSHWATKARVWFELKSMVPFVTTSEWLQRGGSAYTDANPHYPGTVPLLQAWGATVLGRWDDALVNLPWWLTGVAFALAIYGFLAQRGFDALRALIGAWLVVSLPILDVHIALAGYADLPLAAYLTLAVLAGWRWTEDRGRADAALALSFVAACMLIKNPGKVWVLTLLPGAVVALAPRHGIRVAVASLVVAVAVLVVLARLDVVLLGYRLHLEFELPWRGLIDAYLVYANWHLLWYGAIAAAIVGWRDLLSRELAPLTMVIAAGLLFLFFGFAFTNARLWVEDQSTVNRATLHLAPLLVVWMLLAFRAWMARLPPILADPVARALEEPAARAPG
jgi:hypothetical protein